LAQLNRAARTIGLLVLFAALATVHTWPMPRDPAHLTRLDNNDTAFNTWVVAWVAHQLAHDPRNLFEAPIFHPARHALAFSEHMVVQAVMGAPLQWAGVSPVLVYNILVWIGFALSGFAMALLLEVWTGSAAAGVMAGSLYAFNAHQLTRYSHLQALHLEFFPIALWSLDRLFRDTSDHRTDRGHPATRLGLLLGAGFVLQALCSNDTMVMMTFALLAAGVVRPEPWRLRTRLWRPLAITGVVSALALVPFLWPYYLVRREQGLVRTIEDVRIYSAGILDYFVTAGRLHFDWWSHRVFENRTALFPGVMGFLLAMLAIVSGVAWRDARARMALAFGVTGFALSFGANLPGYEWLQTNIPLMQGIRAASRWGVLFLTAVAMLAGFAVAWLESRWRRYWWCMAALIALIGIVNVEALRAPLAVVHFDGIPAVHSRLATDDVKAIVVFPLFSGRIYHGNAPYMLHQTRHWKPMLNAYSSFAPPIFFELAAKFQSFPDAASIAALRAHGFSHVVLHRAPLDRDYGKPAVDALRAHPDLDFVLEQDGVIIYRVRPAAR
jgi:hypothetical protein